MAKTIKMGAPKSIEGTMTGQETLTVQDMGRCENLKLHDAETIENGGAMKTAMGLMAQYVDDVEEGVTEALKVDVVGDGEVTSDELDGVYECIKNELLAAASTMEGDVTADAAYDDAIALIQERFPDLDVTALVEYVRFKDPLVLSTLLTAYGKTGGLTNDDVESATTIPSFSGKAITSFDEFEKFVGISETPVVFMNNCTFLKSIKFPPNLLYINAGYNNPSGFYGCSNLESVIFNDSIKSLYGSWGGGGCGFGNCTKLQLTTLPDSIETIGYGVFGGCSNITLDKLPNNIKTLGERSFLNCSKITISEIPITVTSLGVMAFSGCSSIRQMQINAQLKLIPIATFWSCSSLEKVELPNSCVEIAGGDIWWRGGAFQNCTKLKNINIPNNLEKITNSNEGMGAFRSCSSLKINSLPETLTYIGSFAFYGCSNIDFLHIKNPIPAILGTSTYGMETFGGTTFKLYVGDGSSAEHDQAILDAYLADTNWATYSSRLDTWYNALQEHPEYAE